MIEQLKSNIKALAMNQGFIQLKQIIKELNSLQKEADQIMQNTKNL